MTMPIGPPPGTPMAPGGGLNPIHVVASPPSSVNGGYAQGVGHHAAAAHATAGHAAAAHTAAAPHAAAATHVTAAHTAAAHGPLFVLAHIVIVVIIALVSFMLHVLLPIGIAALVIYGIIRWVRHGNASTSEGDLHDKGGVQA